MYLMLVRVLQTLCVFFEPRMVRISLLSLNLYNIVGLLGIFRYMKSKTYIRLSSSIYQAFRYMKSETYIGFGSYIYQASHLLWTIHLFFTFSIFLLLGLALLGFQLFLTISYTIQIFPTFVHSNYQRQYPLSCERKGIAPDVLNNYLVWLVAQQNHVY